MEFLIFAEEYTDHEREGKNVNKYLIVKALLIQSIASGIFFMNCIRVKNSAKVHKLNASSKRSPF